jgi:hypothetical protein
MGLAKKSGKATKNKKSGKANEFSREEKGKGYNI